MTTDLDTGEHTAALVELMGDPQVGERQPRPAAAKKIRGRTLDVDVLTGEGPRLSRLSARGVTPSPPQEVEGILRWSKAKKKSKTPRPVFPKVGTGRRKPRIKPSWLRLPRLPGQGRKR